MSRPVSTGHLADRITSGIKALGQNPRRHPVELYVSFLQLLWRWNQAYNLTAVKDPETMVTHHILDSLAVLPFLHGSRVLDVGTGAGLPGLVLALATPERYWVLLDSRRKKARFVRQAIMELHLLNCESVCSRVESYRPAELFTTVITRAFGSLHKFHDSAGHLLAPDGILLALKGGDISGEIAGLQGAQDTPVTIKVHKLDVPGMKKERCLVEMAPSGG